MNEELTNWKKKNSDLVKLQWVYAAVGVTLLVVAGLVGLLDQPLAFALLDVVRLVFIVFAVNFVTWAIAKNFVVAQSGRSTSKK